MTSLNRELMATIVELRRTIDELRETRDSSSKSPEKELNQELKVENEHIAR